MVWVHMLYIVIVFAALMVAAWVLKKVLYLFDSRCSYYSICEHYDVRSNTCNKTAGQYYQSGHCGSYRKHSGWV